ncbi:MAG: ThuA domain-containing protein [Ilumatobacteraceae bacterium]
MERRIDAYLVCGGKYHDFDFARLELLELLAGDDHVRVRVAQHFGDVAAIEASDFLVTYTCDLRPTAEEQQVVRTWVEQGGRWVALHGTNCILDPPGPDGPTYRAPRSIAVWADTLGSQFLSHPSIEPYTVRRSPGAGDDPLVAGIDSFESDDELYLMEHHGDVVPLLETRWTGTTRGFADADWPDDEPRLVLYRRPLGAGEVVYFTLGHCRSHWDMVDPPHNGARWPTIDRGSWEIPEFTEIIRRAIAWAAEATPRAARSGARDV